MASIIRLGFEGDDVKFLQEEFKALCLRGLKDYVRCTLFDNSPFLHEHTAFGVVVRYPSVRHILKPAECLRFSCRFYGVKP